MHLTHLSAKLTSKESHLVDSPRKAGERQVSRRLEEELVLKQEDLNTDQQQIKVFI
ncbi:MAG: hypothetical protein AVDCRST_MAG74-363 [uncultured Pyrinomonadaceae bacterium]|uniref:Uncharacterized protein n=1 Tax=uncultured Pyrinomonadaceae bacterium TaxID=2283094 RepID=A0A6J4N8F0_9BACT|nr:MAG: hypothetical protein AVDCRST_MAG74-363 [uncultured Pyrinomonadaceae bacterium]